MPKREKEYRGEELIFPRAWVPTIPPEDQLPTAEEMSEMYELIDLEILKAGPEWFEMDEGRKAEYLRRIDEIKDKHQIKDQTQESVDDEIPF